MLLLRNKKGLIVDPKKMKRDQIKRLLARVGR